MGDKNTAGSPAAMADIQSKLEQAQRTIAEALRALSSGSVAAAPLGATAAEGSPFPHTGQLQLDPQSKLESASQSTGASASLRFRDNDPLGYNTTLTDAAINRKGVQLVFDLHPSLEPFTSSDRELSSAVIELLQQHGVVRAVAGLTCNTPAPVETPIPGHTPQQPPAQPPEQPPEPVPVPPPGPQPKAY